MSKLGLTSAGGAAAEPLDDVPPVSADAVAVADPVVEGAVVEPVPPAPPVPVPVDGWTVVAACWLVPLLVPVALPVEVPLAPPVAVVPAAAVPEFIVPVAVVAVVVEGAVVAGWLAVVPAAEPVVPAAGAVPVADWPAGARAGAVLSPTSLRLMA
jgi:hypothetical protein